MIPNLAFASCYVYSPQGAGAAGERSLLLRNLLKAGDPQFIIKYVARVRQQVTDGSPLAGFFCATQVLVPVPGSAPSVAGIPSVAEQLASALMQAGLGHDLWRGLRRISPVGKSATAVPGSRPSVGKHYDSFAVERPMQVPGFTPPQVLLIDDVVTKGRTLLAAAARVHDAFPEAEIRAFALLRTMGFACGVDRLLEPCVGKIRLRAGDAYRCP